MGLLVAGRATLALVQECRRETGWHRQRAARGRQRRVRDTAHLPRVYLRTIFDVLYDAAFCLVGRAAWKRACCCGARVRCRWHVASQSLLHCALCSDTIVRANWYSRDNQHPGSGRVSLATSWNIQGHGKSFLPAVSVACVASHRL
jgi:hypothetical protein